MPTTPIPTRFFACRSWRHAWDPTTVERRNGAYRQGLKCARCDTEKYILISVRSGALIGHGYYRYTSGYQVKGGLKPTDLNRIRLAEVRSATR